MAASPTTSTVTAETPHRSSNITDMAIKTGSGAATAAASLTSNNMTAAHGTSAANSQAPSASSPSSAKDSGTAGSLTAVPSSPAAHAVFTTNELFENILLGLDMKTLLLSQRVNSHWREVISQSKLLQKKLFLLPASKDDLARLNLLESVVITGIESIGDTPSVNAIRM